MKQMTEKDRQWVMRDASEVLGTHTPNPKIYGVGLSYNPKDLISIPIYEFWDKILEFNGRTFKLLYPLSWDTKYTARYKEITDEKE